MSKYIKLEDAIRAFTEWFAFSETVEGIVADLPTIEADEDWISRAFALEVINDCINYPTNGDKACAIKNAQRVVPSEDCISRAEVIAEFERRKHKLYEDDYYDELMWIIENIESVVPTCQKNRQVERAEGEWITEEKDSIYGKKIRLTCSECGDVFDVTEEAFPYERYCRYCGAKMKDGAEAEAVKKLLPKNRK